MDEILSIDEARRLVDSYMQMEDKPVTTQEILDSGEVPRLHGYIVRPGKVSDSIFGGKGRYVDKKTGAVVEFENPLLNTKNGTPLRPMVRSRRISTHDIERGSIPFKDQILALNHNFMRRLVSDHMGSSQYEVPGLSDNSVVVAAENLRLIPVEMVWRAYMAKSTTETSLYVHYMREEREFCGHKLPNDLVPNGPLPYLMDTPSTKSDEHDISQSPEKMIEEGYCTEGEYIAMRLMSGGAFQKVARFLEKKGIILVDTKTEHGIDRRGDVRGQDEFYTMDSSRFWCTDDFDAQWALFSRGDEKGLVEYLQGTQPGIKSDDYMVGGRVIICPKSYSKEFARGFSRGKEGYTDEQRAQIAVRYIEGIQHLLGRRFEPDMRSYRTRVVDGLNRVVEELAA